MKAKLISVLRWGFIIFLITITIWLINQVGIEQIRAYLQKFGVWAPLILILLRAFSIVIPALPGTAYALLAGGLFGFYQGLIVIILADLLVVALFGWFGQRQANLRL